MTTSMTIPFPEWLAEARGERASIRAHADTSKLEVTGTLTAAWEYDGHHTLVIGGLTLHTRDWFIDNWAIIREV